MLFFFSSSYGLVDTNVNVVVDGFSEEATQNSCWHGILGKVGSWTMRRCAATDSSPWCDAGKSEAHSMD